MGKHLPEAVRKKSSQNNTLNVCLGDKIKVLRNQLQIASEVEEYRNRCFILNQSDSKVHPPPNPQVNIKRRTELTTDSASNVPSSDHSEPVETEHREVSEIDYRERADNVLDRWNLANQQTIDCCQEKNLWQQDIITEVLCDISGHNVEGKSSTCGQYVVARFPSSQYGEIRSSSEQNVAARCPCCENVVARLPSGEDVARSPGGENIARSPSGEIVARSLSCENAVVRLLSGENVVARSPSCQRGEAIFPSCQRVVARSPSCHRVVARSPSCHRVVARSPSCHRVVARSPSCQSVVAGSPSCNTAIAKSSSIQNVATISSSIQNFATRSSSCQHIVIKSTSDQNVEIKSRNRQNAVVRFLSDQDIESSCSPTRFQNSEARFLAQASNVYTWFPCIQTVSEHALTHINVSPPSLPKQSLSSDITSYVCHQTAKQIIPFHDRASISDHWCVSEVDHQEDRVEQCMEKHQNNKLNFHVHTECKQPAHKIQLMQERDDSLVETYLGEVCEKKECYPTRYKSKIALVCLNKHTNMNTKLDYVRADGTHHNLHNVVGSKTTARDSYSYTLANLIGNVKAPADLKQEQFQDVKNLLYTQIRSQLQGKVCTRRCTSKRKIAVRQKFKHMNVICNSSFQFHRSHSAVFPGNKELNQKQQALKESCNLSMSKQGLMYSTINDKNSHKLSKKYTKCYNLQSSRTHKALLHMHSSHTNLQISNRSVNNHLNKYTPACKSNKYPSYMKLGFKRANRNSSYTYIINTRGRRDTDDKYYKNIHGHTRHIQSHCQWSLGMKKRLQFTRRLYRVFHYSLQHELLPSYFLNVNSNAGISETAPDGIKTETKQPSCTSVHSSDQYYSTHTDTPDGKITDSDMEASPSFSFAEDAMDKPAVNIHGDCEPTPSKSCEQTKHVDNDLESNKQNMKASCSEISKIKRQRKNLEETNADDCVDMRGGKQVSTNQTPLACAQEEVHSHSGNKHKRKTKTTETLYIKFESSMSKKVTTTTLVKDGKKPAINKQQRTEQQKLLPSADDLPKEITGVPDKVVENPRYTKIIRCSDGYHVSPENPLKCTEAPSPPAMIEEPYQNVTLQSQEHRAAECDNYSSHAKILSASNCKLEAQSQDKKHYSMLERLTSQRSPNRSHSPPSSLENKADIMDSDYASEKESSAATIVNIPNLSPGKESCTPRESKDNSIKNELINKTDKQKKSDSPKRDSKNITDKKDQLKHSAPTQKDGSLNKEEDQAQSETLPTADNEKQKLEITSFGDIIVRRKSLTRQKVDSPLKKSSTESTSKNETKKVSTKGRSKTAEDLNCRDETNEPSKGKSLHSSTLTAKKRSPARIKGPSRSPDYKKRKRNAKKSTESKSSNSIDSTKSDKGKKQKLCDKLVADKKKKKKKQKQKGTGKTDEEASDSVQQTKKIMPLSRSHSTESNKTTQTQACSISAPHFIETTLLADQISPLSNWKGNDNSMGERHKLGMEVRSLDRDSTTQNRDLKIKGRAASSVENVSICTVAGTNKPIRSAESVPTFTGTVYTTLTKVVQVTSCPKMKRSEKDLQKAESGWNSSTLSAEERAAEKAKLYQKRAKARYYLNKPKFKRSYCEAGSKLKRPVPRRSQADGDTSVPEVSDKDNLAQQDRAKPLQAKSVQFSDSTEDHEAVKDDTVDEKTVSNEVSDDNDGVHQSVNKATNDVLKQLNKLDAEILTPGKLPGQKKDESRSQTTPPRKKRLIWLKKQPKDKYTANNRAGTMAKSVSALVPLKQLQTPENTQKPSSRFNIHLYYPVKQKLESSNLSNISLDDKKTVAYNTWINSTILAAPMNKATRKLVAKTGSPVDIKEIIEGSSVDATDYYRTMKSIHDLGVRAAKSVPSLGPQRTAGTDLVGNRRVKLHGESRVTFQKRNKEMKVQESGSARSLSSPEGIEDQGVCSKIRPGGMDASLSPASSTDIDIAGGFRHKIGHSRFLGQSQFRRDKKHNKKSQDNISKWHIVNAQDVHSVPDLTRVQYYGDMMEFNTINMGFSWMVQSVFNRFPFLNQRSASAANASGDRTIIQQAEE